MVRPGPIWYKNVQLVRTQLPGMHVSCCCLESCRRRRLRFGDKPSWPQVAPSPQRQQTGPPINPSLDNPNSTLLYLSERWHRLSNALADGWGKLLYNYFNWRQDTSKDLLLIFMLFSSFVLLGSSMRHWVIDDETEQSGGGFWNDIYQVHSPDSVPSRSCVCSSWCLLVQASHGPRTHMCNTCGQQARLPAVIPSPHSRSATTPQCRVWSWV